MFTGWADAESNYLSSQSVFALDFFNGLGVPIGSATLDLVGAGLFVPNGQPFNYKFYSLQAVAPAGTAVVRARISMIDGIANPAGGGQAFVVDDFTLSVVDTVPEPGTVTLLAAGLVAAAWKWRQAVKR